MGEGGNLTIVIPVVVGASLAARGNDKGWTCGFMRKRQVSEKRSYPKDRSLEVYCTLGAVRSCWVRMVDWGTMRPGLTGT